MSPRQSCFILKGFSMDRTTASYYRSILFHDGEDQRPLPQSLVRMHAWAFKCCQNLGIGSVITKQAALGVVMNWLIATKDGRAFAIEFTTIGDLLCSPEDDAKADSISDLPASDDWDNTPAQSKVTVLIDDKPTAGKFIGRRGAWIDVKVGSETKPYLMSQVQIAGA